MKKNTMMNATIAMLNSTSGMTMIRPTELERLHGRLMRAPDHDGSGGGDGAGADGAGGEGAGDDTGAADKGDKATGADGGADGDDGTGAKGDGAADGAGDDDATIMGSAKTGEDGGDGADKDKPGEGDGDGDGDDDKTETVPETYELKPITLGEGDDAVEMEVDPELLTEATPLLKAAGLTNKQAQELAPLAAKIEARVLKHQGDVFNGIKADWAKAAKADEEIGGAKWDTTLANVAKAMDYFGAKSEMKEVDGKQVETNPFRKLLNDTGIGNHPDLIKMFAKIGAAAGEDGTLPRGDKGPVGKPKAREEVLYPNDVPKT